MVDGPLWVHADRFNITATAADGTSRETMRLMLQSLLADRFQLQVARETRTGTVYTLVARNVRNLKPAAKPDERSIVSTVREIRDGFLSFYYDGRNATMAALVRALSEHASVNAPVTDQTNLSGNYDFRIHFAYDSASGGLGPDPNVPTIFTAIENQLGLRLVAAKGAIPVYSIKRAEKPSPD